MRAGLGAARGTVTALVAGLVDRGGCNLTVLIARLFAFFGLNTMLSNMAAIYLKLFCSVRGRRVLLGRNRPAIFG